MHVGGTSMFFLENDGYVRFRELVTGSMGRERGVFSQDWIDFGK